MHGNRSYASRNGAGILRQEKKGRCMKGKVRGKTIMRARAAVLQFWLFFFVTCFNFVASPTAVLLYFILIICHLSFCNVAIIACSSMLYCSVEVLHASPASFVLPWHRPSIDFVYLLCANISFDWGCHACYCLPLILGFWYFAISPPYREAFHLCSRWERLLFRILSPLFYPALNRD